MRFLRFFIYEIRSGKLWIKRGVGLESNMGFDWRSEDDTDEVFSVEVSLEADGSQEREEVEWRNQVVAGDELRRQVNRKAFLTVFDNE